RFRVRTLLIAVVVAAGSFSLLRGLRDLSDNEYPGDGPHEFRLTVGQRVIVFGKKGTQVPVDTPGGDSSLAVGTRCVVVSDPATDRDSCFAGLRGIEVRVSEGRHKDEIATITRMSLRVR